MIAAKLKSHQVKEHGQANFFMQKIFPDFFLKNQIICVKHV